MWLRKWKFWEVAVEKGFAGSMEGYDDDHGMVGLD